ncbi:hypothetical protein [Hamadaea tsunoensis]|uniref:hypothetical protein n=1 Tax=Hamadaea tsunoensis TaxID=53368 RepID=UPI0012F9B25D|nr:hypothetical protein [Hamadaea tsunoensis]
MTVFVRGSSRGTLVLLGLGLLALALMLAAAGCAKKDDGSKVASVTGTASAQPGASPTPTLSEQDRSLKFAQCMRDHGVPMDDPKIDGNGGIQVQIGGNVKKEDVDAAQKACKDYSPGGGPGGGKVDPALQENMRKMAQCMRESGVPNFPDPSADGGIAIDGSIAEDPDFKAAQEKCMKLIPPPSGKAQIGSLTAPGSGGKG